MKKVIMKKDFNHILKLLIIIYFELKTDIFIYFYAQSNMQTFHYCSFLFSIENFYLLYNFYSKFY